MNDRINMFQILGLIGLFLLCFRFITGTEPGTPLQQSEERAP